MREAIGILKSKVAAILRGNEELESEKLRLINESSQLDASLKSRCRAVEDLEAAIRKLETT